MPELFDELDLFVDRCEAAWRESEDVDLELLLPPADHPDYAEIAIELLRVDLDHRLTRGQNVDVQRYLNQFPQVLAEQDSLALLAFEEYRLRLQAGEAVSPADYSSRYGVCTDDWLDPAAMSTVPAVGDVSVPGHPADDPELVPGHVFADFVLERELGRGALARVFQARQTGIADRTVVLKFTAIRTVEIERLGRLQHSNIVPILSVHSYRQGAAICMPFLGPKTMADVLAERGAGGENVTGETRPAGRAALSGREWQRQVLDWAIGLTAGLQHAHERDILHGDVKPANILLADDGRAMLLDFNLAGDLTSLRPEVVGGTFRYMPPEHKLAFQAGAASIHPDVRGDLYSLGVVLLELLTGSAEVLADDRDYRLSANTTPALAAIVQRCLASDPADRYQSADQLLEDLTRQRDNLPLRYQPEPSLRERLSKWVRRHPRLASNVTLLTLFAVVLTAGAVGWTSRSRELRRLSANADFELFQQRLPQVRALLVVNRGERAAIDEGLQQANELLGQAASEQRPGSLGVLSPDRQKLFRDGIGQLLYYTAQGYWLRSAQATDEEGRAADLKSARDFNLRAADWFRAELGRVPAAVGLQASRLAGRPSSVGPSDSDASAEDPLDRLLFATELNQARRFEQTCRYLDGVKADFADDLSFWVLLGSAYSGNDAYEKAETCFTACLALNPQSWITLSDRGLARMALRQFEDAEADFADVIRLRPDYYGGYLNRALARAGQRDYQAAIDDLTRAIERRGPTRAYFLRSRYRAAVGDRAGAAADRARGLETVPNDEKSWVSRGVARMQQDPRGALEDFRTATRLNPTSVDAWRNIAHVLSERLGDADGAIAALNTITESGSRDAGAFAGRAVLHARAGRADAAIADAEAALKISDEPLTRYQAACVYALLADEKPDYRRRAFSLLSTSLRDLPRVLVGLAEQDPDLKPLRDVPEWGTLLEAARSLYALEKGLKE